MWLVVLVPMCSSLTVPGSMDFTCLSAHGCFFQNGFQSADSHHGNWRADLAARCNGRHIVLSVSFLMLLSVYCVSQSASSATFSPATPTRRKGYRPVGSGLVGSPATPSLLVAASADRILRMGSFDTFFAGRVSPSAATPSGMSVARSGHLALQSVAGGSTPLSATSPSGAEPWVPLPDRSSTLATGFNIINIFVGLGLLSKPYAFSQVVCTVIIWTPFSNCSGSHC